MTGGRRLPRAASRAGAPGPGGPVLLAGPPGGSNSDTPADDRRGSPRRPPHREPGRFPALRAGTCRGERRRARNPGTSARHSRARRLGGLAALVPSDPAVAGAADHRGAPGRDRPGCSGDRAQLPAPSGPGGDGARCGPVQAIARVCLAPDKPREAFERQLQAIPAVLSAVHVTGDVDYEFRLACRDVADLGAALTVRHVTDVRTFVAI